MKASKINIRRVTLVALTSAFISVSAMISIPAPIPFTLQIFAIFFALFFLGGKLGTVSVLIYICLGALGLPVFSGFQGGFYRLFDTGGGFIFGFLFASLVYWLLTVAFGDKTKVVLLSSVIAMLVIYIAGALWYAVLYLGGIGSLGVAFVSTVLPFLLPDLLKISFAYLLSVRLKKIIKV